MPKASAGSYKILNAYLLRRFLISLLVAFSFFFFIFFINQLLLFAQKVLLKNVQLISVLKLIGLSIPQILLYSIPFSVLSGSAMTIGEFSENNEILAFRSCGIALKRVFGPIVVAAFVMAIATFFVADVMLPFSNYKFKELYAELMQDLPTLEIEPFAVNKVGNISLITKNVNENEIENILLYDSEQNKIVSAKKGQITLIDLDTYLYKLEMEEVAYFYNEGSSLKRFDLAKAENMIYYLDFSNQISKVTDISPSQLSSRDLLKLIEIRKRDLHDDELLRQNTLLDLNQKLLELLREGESNKDFDLNKIAKLENDITKLEKQRSINYYLQYYRAELHKKFALSISCIILVLITFPLALLRLKHGRLFGFGLSLVVASTYWFTLFFAQLKILDVTFNSGFLIWIPNMIVALIATTLLLNMRRL